MDITSGVTDAEQRLSQAFWADDAGDSDDPRALAAVIRDDPDAAALFLARVLSLYIRLLSRQEWGVK